MPEEKKVSSISGEKPLSNLPFVRGEARLGGVLSCSGILFPKPTQMN